MPAMIGMRRGADLEPMPTAEGQRHSIFGFNLAQDRKSVV
jgi:hypothetical protein